MRLAWLKHVRFYIIMEIGIWYWKWLHIEWNLENDVIWKNGYETAFNKILYKYFLICVLYLGENA